MLCRQKPIRTTSKNNCQALSPLYRFCYAVSANCIQKNAFSIFPKGYRQGPVPQEGIPGPCPPSEDCVPKKLTGPGLLECKSRPKTPKLVFTALKFVIKNCFFVIFVDLHQVSFKFWDENLFFLVFTSEFVENHKNFETTTRICGNLGTNTFFFFGLFRLIHTRINFSCPRVPLEFT